MNPTIPYLIHAARNAAKARDWFHLDLLLDELTEAVQAPTPQAEQPKEWWRTFNVPRPGGNPFSPHMDRSGNITYR